MPQSRVMRFVTSGLAVRLEARSWIITALRYCELFSKPEIRANNNSLQEGDLLTITCHTVLNPARANTELQFAFYRNGHNVQGFHSSNHYTIQSARPQDSGSYTCHTAAPSVSVTKGSKELTIYIQGEYEMPGGTVRERSYTIENIIRLVLSVCILISASFLCYFHKNNHVGLINLLMRL
ncbi:high affinity immunoglobulin gamma Fc receptor I isoform X1 [Xenopus laevis]|uniref:high affinity immunoglobulin gamma Fc receptor I isoform X1 n=1 Tax=Xenopus laevis TaxID=8355 RepID=UPI00084D882F|nr:high affinity immunoglobulin gamma Fc receptor I isoform X1 [Xenopus laevis]